MNIARLSRTTASTVHHNCPKLSSSFRPATVQFPSRYWLSTSPKKPIIHAYFRRSPPLSIHQRSWKCSIVVAIYRFIVAQRNAPVRSPAAPAGRAAGTSAEKVTSLKAGLSTIVIQAVQAPSPPSRTKWRAKCAVMRGLCIFHVASNFLNSTKYPRKCILHKHCIFMQWWF